MEDCMELNEGSKLLLLLSNIVSQRHSSAGTAADLRAGQLLLGPTRNFVTIYVAACAEPLCTVSRLRCIRMRVVITVIECFGNCDSGLKHMQTVTRVSKAFNHSDGDLQSTILQSANSFGNFSACGCFVLVIGCNKNIDAVCRL